MEIPPPDLARALSCCPSLDPGTYAVHFKHPGRARDEALVVFWQVAPATLGEPYPFAAASLDPDVATERMVTAIKASSVAGDFTWLAEQFFRAVANRTLTVMLADSASWPVSHRSSA
jgi:hypothetical protein